MLLQQTNLYLALYSAIYTKKYVSQIENMIPNLGNRNIENMV